MDATGQSELVRAREVKPIELVEAAIGRAGKVNDELNCVVTPMYDLAREAAAGALPEGPFEGVPFLLKDLMAAYAGVPMTFASRFLADFVPDHDSELVVRYKRAGLLTIGKTNASEFGLLPTSEPVLFGACHNPWDVRLSTGGSSGGSAAAVASGIVPMAHANDAGGSIRIPASCCGLFGMRPTRARISMGPDIGDVMSGLVVEHAVTRSVRDSATLLDATCGPAIGDPYFAPPPDRPFIEEIGADPGRLRIGFTVTSPTEGDVHPDCVKAVRQAAALCEEFGHDVEEMAIELDTTMVTQAFTAVYCAGAAWSIEATAMMSGKVLEPHLFEPLTWAMHEIGKALPAPDYLLAVSALQMMGRVIMRLFSVYDAVLSPTITEPPYELGRFDAPEDNPLVGLLRAANLVPFTAIANFTGLPAMSMPLYWNEAGLPLGIQFTGRYADEAGMFRLAAQLEEARPWADRRPAVSAGWRAPAD
ncbi:MAG: amidase [Actinobacteria bacterium]|nr:amidase [Actinomycetota bacterium]MBU1943080.1 amidase [Actinomycetota bacterium]MBU2687973.1 amidase [Actinomycetota bacterium]